MDGAFGPLLKTVGWAIVFFVLCPSSIWIIFRLIFAAYFKAKEKYEGGAQDGK